MTDAIQKAREELRGQLALLHSLANDTTEANWRDKRLYILQTCVRMSDALAALDAETPATPADVGEEPVAAYIQREALAALAQDKTAKATVSSGLLKAPFGDPVPLYSATALEQVTRERDETRATLDEVCLSSRQEWQRATTAEAKLAEARKVIEPFARAADNAERLAGHDGPLGQYVELEHLRAARRFLEETK